MLKFFSLTMLLWLPLNAVNAEVEPVSLTFDQAPVAQVIQTLAEWKGLNVLVAPEVEGTISLRLQGVPWEQALSLIVKMARLSVMKEGNVLMVYPSIAEGTGGQLYGSDSLPAALENRIIELAYANADEVSRHFTANGKQLMTSHGSITADSRANRILLRDTSQALDDTERWIKALDVPVEQVELAAHIVTIGEESLRELGVRWGNRSDEQVSQALRRSQLRVDTPVANPAFSAGFTVAKMSGALLDLELSALEQEHKLEIIASPRLFTSHQQTASIKQGTEIPYEVASGNQGKTSIEFKEAVLGMQVTPLVLPHGRITLKLHISQNVPSKTVRSGGGEYLAIDKQEIQTEVTITDGQTLALGGIFQQHHKQDERKVPLMGDMPGIGAPFRYTADEQKRRELVVFITPRLVRGS
ncbi:MAG: Type IV pilus biogenesis and competence protein PilQ [Candidatus Erwinia impunctatus]|nr:Type IV pilus biogenesis and competence protein PilQ [Culicoides impunctatus]